MTEVDVPLSADEIEHMAKELGLALLLGVAIGDVSIDVLPASPDAADNRAWIEVHGGKAVAPYLADLLAKHRGVNA